MSLTVLILTRDEAVHIERAIASVRAVADRIVVVDSGSTDDTCDRARRAGAEVSFHAWTNYSRQLNWALDNSGIDTDWTLRLDADEVVLPDLAAQLASLDGLDPGMSGFTVNRRYHFLGRWIRHGTIYPVRMLRLWRSGRARCEDRWMDEHMIVTGAVGHIDADIADINLHSIGWWTDKHNRYATREAIDLLRAAGGADSSGQGASPGRQAARKRWLKDHVYARLPLGLRPLLYFLYRYFLRLGFLDGWQGLAFHGLQGGWYRFLVDVKISELQAAMAGGDDLATVVERIYGIRLE